MFAVDLHHSWWPFASLNSCLRWHRKLRRKLDIQTVRQKVSHMVFVSTHINIDNSSKLFHWCTYQEMCNIVIIYYPATFQMHWCCTMCMLLTQPFSTQLEFIKKTVAGKLDETHAGVHQTFVRIMEFIDITSCIMILSNNWFRIVCWCPWFKQIIALKCPLFSSTLFVQNCPLFPWQAKWNERKIALACYKWWPNYSDGRINNL